MGGVVDLFPSSLPIFANLGRDPAGRAWLDQLPDLVAAVCDRWSLTLATPYPGGSCAWVAPATRVDGTRAVVKLSWPHREAAGEAAALYAWAGHRAVRLLAHDPDRHALLLEHADGGTDLGTTGDLTTEQRLHAGADILHDLWATTTDSLDIEPLSAVTNWWADALDERRDRLHAGHDPGLLEHGSRLLRDLPATATASVLLHGDFNPGNILAARRWRWLAIDPKPMIGDPAFDLVPLIDQIDDPYQHPPPVLRNRTALIADRLNLDPDRILAWALVRHIEYAMCCANDGDHALAAEAIANARTVANTLGI